jgi:hypothetical protein
MTVNVGFGQINGTDDQILSSAPNTHHNGGEGDLEPGDPGAQPGGGGQDQVVDSTQSFPWGDGIPVAKTMSDNYHVHTFLGLYVNGQEIAIPDGIGMVNPFGDFSASDPCTGGAPNFECFADEFYYMHTHDASGIVHMEGPMPVCGGWQQPPAPPCPTIFTLGNFLDVWGITISPANFGPFTGPVTIYTSPLGVFNPCSGSPCYTGSNTYSLYTGDPRAIPLQSHTVIWILVGSGNPTGSSLPNVQWFVAH